MFTITQIHKAHSKVTSGADFPAYIQDLVKLGVVSYTTVVTDGHAEYDGAQGSVTSDATYDTLDINPTSNKEGFITDLLAHQQGHTDYMTFCQDAAKHGIAKRVVNTQQMTCSYYDLDNNEILVEEIPH